MLVKKRWKFVNYKSHLLSQARTPLQDVIPLDTPFTILLELSRICNLKCRFCPQSDKNSFYMFDKKFLHIEEIEKIIDQVKAFPNKLKKIYLHGTGESTLNSELAQIVAFIKESGVTEQIDLTTNGVLLTEELGKQLVESGINHIHISLEALSDEDYNEITQTNKNYYSVVFKNIKDFYRIRGNCRLSVKIASVSLKSEDDKTKFLQTFSPYCDEIFVENIFPIWPLFKLPYVVKEDGVGQYGQTVVEKKVCPQIFTTLAIKSDLTVSACSMDYNNTLALGNLNQETLYEIWNGERLSELRNSHLQRGRNEVMLCRGCGLPKYSCIDNLDEYSHMITKKLNERVITSG